MTGHGAAYSQVDLNYNLLTKFTDYVLEKMNEGGFLSKCILEWYAEGGIVCVHIARRSHIETSRNIVD